MLAAENVEQILTYLQHYALLWAVTAIVAMAITAVTLYFFWDLVGRGIGFAARLLNVARSERRD